MGDLTDPTFETTINTSAVYEALSDSIVGYNTLHENKLTEAMSTSQAIALNIAEKIKDAETQPRTKDEYEALIVESLGNGELDQTAYELIMDALPI